ncbi:1,2-phenylacetyl-CoA epoxidase subunit PaaB [Blastococcus capsensis]|uniref:1,2-phenylacetyl-CoA epoxidase subunit PaaB n=1 Tax=Blastococcus capsensis TaxID=1564163 RepID=UPI0032B0648E
MTGLTAEGGHGAKNTPSPPPLGEGPRPPHRSQARGEPPDGAGPGRGRDWPLYEVFVRGKRGLNHVHVGSLHAPDDEMAVHAARDVYTRRNEGVSIWVVQAADITASSPDEKDPMFAPSGDKVYRHPTFYEIPDAVPHM